MSRTQKSRHGEEHDRIGYPTRYNGVEFRSRLEVDFARALDRANIRWWYEPRIFRPARNSESLSWIADFIVIGVPGGFGRSGTAYVELKSADLTPSEIARQLRRVSVAWETDPAVVVQLIIWKWGEGAVLVFTGRHWEWSVRTGHQAGVIYPWPGGGNGA